MKKITLAASLLIVPAIVQAQGSIQAQSQTNANAAASVKSAKKVELSAESQAKVDANVRAARERKLPDEPIRQRVAEGQAKGASDAQIVAASGRTLVDLQSSFDAMARGGHSTPSDDEVSRGAQLLARGYTSVQIEGVARKAPSERSLVVAFETLTSLQAQGKSSARAVAQLESLLEARASDAQLRGVAVGGEAGAGLAGAVNVGRGAGNAAGSATGSASGTAAGGLGAATGGAKAGATGTVTGTVGGVLGKKP